MTLAAVAGPVAYYVQYSSILSLLSRRHLVIWTGTARLAEPLPYRLLKQQHLVLAAGSGPYHTLQIDFVTADYVFRVHAFHQFSWAVQYHRRLTAKFNSDDWVLAS